MTNYVKPRKELAQWYWYDDHATLYGWLQHPHEDDTYFVQPIVITENAVSFMQVTFPCDGVGFKGFEGDKKKIEELAWETIIEAYPKSYMSFFAHKDLIKRYTYAVCIDAIYGVTFPCDEGETMVVKNPYSRESGITMSEYKKQNANEYGVVERAGNV
jgi:hypothetical protein